MPDVPAGYPCLERNGLPRLRYNTFAPSPKQAAFLAWQGREALFGGAGGGGKELDLQTPVLTADGWATIGDLRVGDRIFDHDGELTTVTHLHDIHYVEAFRVTLTDGETILACADHLWNVATAKQRMNWRRTDPHWQAKRRAGRASRGRTAAQRELVADGRARGTALAASERNSRVAVLERAERERPSPWDYTTTMTTAEVRALAAVEREKLAIPCGAPLRTTGEWRSAIPPYTLGAWLGDGVSRAGYICVCEADRDAMVAELEADGWNVRVAHTRDKEGFQSFHLLHLSRDGVGLIAYLREEGLLRNKHVPTWIHAAPHADRQAFIAGFFDTDGTIDATRGRVEFCLAREDMVRAVHSLLWGLGESPTRVTEIVTRNQDADFRGKAWRFQISGSGPGLFRLPRKRALLPERRSASNEYRMIASIDPTGVTVPMRCLTVDNGRGLYRVGASHLVTHNSIALLMAALQFSDVPGYNAVIFRRTLTDLELPDGLVDVSKDWLDQTDAQWNGNKRRWTFPSGAVLQFAYMNHYGSERRYKSTQFQFIGFDEVTEFPWEEQYLYMFSRLRRGVQNSEQALATYGTAPDGVTLADIPLRVRSATNPGGPGHCVPYGDVLTPSGWRDIRSLEVGDPVFQVDGSGVLEATVVRQVHRHVAKQVVEVNARGLHMACTPEHRVAKVGGTRAERGAAYTLVPWVELPGRATVLRSVEWAGESFGSVRVERVNGRNIQPTELSEVDYATFLGWFLAEGCLVHRDKAIEIAQTKPATRATLAAFLDRCGFTVSPTATGFRLYAADWYEHLRRLEFGKCRDKYVPERILGATPEVLAAFAGAAIDGDGHRYCDTSGTFYSASEAFADGMAEVLVKLGYIVNQNSRQRAARDGLAYAVNYKRTNSGGTELLTGNHVYDVATATHRSSNVTHVDGPVDTYCIGVDSHAFVLRQRGTVWVSGNSWVYHRFVDKTNLERRPFLPSLLADNPGIDADEYRAALAELPEVERRRMEEGDWDVVEIPGALWRFADLRHDEREKPWDASDVDVRAIALDPSVSKEGDECGMIVGSITNGVVSVEVDLSGRFHPDDWAKRAVIAYHEYGATRLVCEDNQGGQLVFSAVGNAADVLGVPRPHVIRVRAKESKEARAIPVSSSYRADRVVHLASVRSGKLEAQMTSWIPGVGSGSPDRVDALVWLVRHLLFREGDVVEYHSGTARQKLSTNADKATALRQRSQALRSGIIRPAHPKRRL